MSDRELLKNIHPDWSSEEVEDTTFQLMTLVLGGWTTMGATRTVYRTQNKNELKTKLLRGVNRLANQRSLPRITPPWDNLGQIVSGIAHLGLQKVLGERSENPLVTVLYTVGYLTRLNAA